MMEYKRFVSYLYRYEGGQRERNAGFVRLEVRNSQCRIRIFLHHLPEMQTEGEAWMFRQDGERFRMVPLGRFTVREGGVEVCLATRADSFLDTGLPVTAFRGLAVFLGAEERLYLTVWDDEPVNLAAIRRRGEEPEKTEERGDSGETGTLLWEQEMSSGTESIFMNPKPSSEKGNIPEENEEASSVRESVPEENEEQLDENEDIVEKQRESLRTEIRDSEKKVIGAAGRVHEKAENQRQSIERDFRIWWRQLLEAGAAVVEKYAGQKQVRLETTELSTDKQENPGEITFGTALPDPSGEISIGASLPDPSGEITFGAPLPDPSPPDWTALCRQLPHFLPGGPTEQREFLRLSLQDIGRLPRAYWDFGKNAFVLYGFSLEGHLILMRERSSACFLGVPGHDLGEDRLAAEMFGFHRYLELGGHGYWLAGIKL